MRKIVILLSICAICCACTTKPSAKTTRDAGVGASAFNSLASSLGLVEIPFTIAGAATGAALSEGMQSRAFSAYQLRKHGIEVIQIGDQLKVIMPSDQLFMTGTARLNEGNDKTMSLLSTLVKDYGGSPVTIAGYTDNIFSPQKSRELSFEQAQRILSELWTRGVAWERMYAVGYGQHDDIGNNHTSYGSYLNRRIEVTVRRSTA